MKTGTAQAQAPCPWEALETGATPWRTRLRAISHPAAHDLEVLDGIEVNELGRGDELTLRVELVRDVRNHHK